MIACTANNIYSLVVGPRRDIWWVRGLRAVAWTESLRAWAWYRLPRRCMDLAGDLICVHCDEGESFRWLAGVTR